MLHTNFQPNIPSQFLEIVDFLVFAFLSIGDYLGFSTRLNFISLKICSLVILHVKFENPGYSDFIE